MKCIILAGGRGTRMLPLTATTPKPLLAVGGQSLIEHILGLFPDAVDHFIVVTGYLGEKIESHIGKTLLGRPVTYVEQKEQKGTYDALLQAKHLISEGERFYVVYGDDMHDPEAIREMLQHEHCILVSEVEDPRAYGVVTIDGDGRVIEIQEKPEQPNSNLVSTGVLLLSSRIFDYHPVPGNKGETVLADAVHMMIDDIPLYTVSSRFWFSITTPEDLTRFETHLKKSI